MEALLQTLSSLSLTTYFILLFSVGQLFAPQLRSENVVAVQFRLACSYLFIGLLITLGWLLGIDLAGSLAGTGAAVTPIAIVMTLGWLALFHRLYAVVVVLLLMLVGFHFRITGNENFWQYFFDPVALVYAAGIVVWQRSRLASLKISYDTLQKWALIVIASFLVEAVYLSHTSPDAFRYQFVVEDGFVEWMTVFILAVAMVVCFRRAFKLRKERSGLFLTVTVLLGLLCLFGAGEEISWGQRIFGLESPEFFQENNAQEEIGLHNLVVEINGEKVKLNKLIFGTGLALAMLIYLFVATPLYRRNQQVRRFFDAIAAPMPQNYHVIGYLAIVATVELLVDHSKRGEMTEFAASLMFALNVIYPYNKELFISGK